MLCEEDRLVEAVAALRRGQKRWRTIALRGSAIVVFNMAAVAYTGGATAPLNGVLALVVALVVAGGARRSIDNGYHVELGRRMGLD